MMLVANTARLVSNQSVRKFTFYLKTRIESIPRFSVGLARYICSSYFIKYLKAHFLELIEL